MDFIIYKDITFTVITPSLPTFFMASAIKSPMALSPLAEIVATCSIKQYPRLNVIHAREKKKFRYKLNSKFYYQFF